MSAGIQLPPSARTVLPNGLTVVVFERRALPLVTLRLTLRAGSSRDPLDLPGSAALAARLLRHGAGSRDSTRFAADLDFIGGHFGTATGVEHLVVDGEFTKASLDEGLELYLSAIFDPLFAEADVLREKERMVGEIVHARDEPDSLADEAFHGFLFAGHPHGRPTSGTVEALRRMTSADIRRWHAERFVPAGGVLVVVGDVDRDAFLERISAHFATWRLGAAVPTRPPEPAKVVGRKAILVHRPGSAQAQYRTGNVGVKRRTPHWHPLVLANAVFGGGFTARLMREVRVVRGLTYGIHSRFLAGHVPGTFTISSFTKNETVAELHGVVTSLLGAMRAEGPTEDEITAAKAYVTGLQVRRVETPEALAAAITEAEIHELGHESLTSFRHDIAAVTRDAAHVAAQEAMPSSDNLLTVVVGDRTIVEATVRDMGELLVVGTDFAENELALPGAAP